MRGLSLLKWTPLFRSRCREVTSTWVFHLFISALIIALVFVHPPSIFSGDTDTARNYLNTIVSSLSTILALCISIILVAIQLTASNYTHRVLDFYVRLPYNASLFLIYLVTIMHSFFLMANIQDPVADPLPARLKPEMSADLILVMICFMSLLLYMYAVVQLLKPERIIELILRDYHRAVGAGKWKAALDNVEQICDIAKRAASVSDSVTGTHCLHAMLNIAARLPLPVDADDPVLEMHQSFLDQWGEIVGVAVKERETGLLQAVLRAMYVQGCIYVDGKSWLNAELVVKAYKYFVFSHLLPEGQTYYAETVAELLYQLAARGARVNARGCQFCQRTLQVIQTIGENVFGAITNASTLMAGFLMVDELPDIFFSLQAAEQNVDEVLVTYFALWKAFLRTATRSDAARFAEWWAQTIEQYPLQSTGQVLAYCLAVHMAREDIQLTLQNIWGFTLQPIPFDYLDTLTERDRRCLFDGLTLGQVLQASNRAARTPMAHS